MPLETLEQGTRIQGLVLETPRRSEGEPFDADKEITKENWDRILKREDSLIDHGEWQRFIEHFWSVRYLADGDNLRHLLFRPKINWVEIKSETRNLRTDRLIFGYLAKAKLLLPEDNYDLDYIRGKWENICSLVKNDNVSEYRWFAFRTLVLFPEYRDRLELDDQFLESLVVEIGQARHARSWVIMCASIFLLRMLYPSEFDKIQISPDEWKLMRKKFRRIDDGSLGPVGVNDMILLAFFMKTIAAQTAKIENGRLVISDEIKKPRKKEEDAPVPEKIKF